MRAALLVALGGAIGSVLRWLLSGVVQALVPSTTFPWGTLVVNVTGSFAIGALLWLVVGRGVLGDDTRLLLVTGLLGGFTTFSAFSWEMLALVRDGQSALAVAYALASVVLGLAAVALGRMLVVR